MIWSAGDGVIRAVAAPGPRARGSLEQALPGEWAALVLTFAAIALVGAVIIVATCVGHERVVARRRARRLRSAARSAARSRAQGKTTRMVA